VWTRRHALRRGGGCSSTARRPGPAAAARPAFAATPRSLPASCRPSASTRTQSPTRPVRSRSPSRSSRPRKPGSCCGFPRAPFTTSPGEAAFLTFASDARSGSRVRTSSSSSAASDRPHKRPIAARPRSGHDNLQPSVRTDPDLELQRQTRRKEHQGLDLGVDLAKLEARDVRLLHPESACQRALRQAILGAVAKEFDRYRARKRRPLPFRTKRGIGLELLRENFVICP
jgi:hypothetical protein